MQAEPNPALADLVENDAVEAHRNPTETLKVGVGKRAPRYRAETQTLEEAVSGDLGAAQGILRYLSSANPELRRIMQRVLHNSRDPRVWRYMLCVIACHIWGDAFVLLGIQTSEETDHNQVMPLLEWRDAATRERCTQAIAEAFACEPIDEKDPRAAEEFEVECARKTAILRQALATSGKIGPQPGTADQRLCVRRTAAYLLGLRGERDVIPVLEQVIEGDDPEWQLRAVGALAVLGSERCVPALLKALTRERGEHRARLVHQGAARALDEMGERGRDAWLEAFNHPDSHIRWHAARGLGQIGDPRGVELLAEALYDEIHSVRWSTARVLASLDSAAIPAILKVIIHQPLNEPFRQAAYHALHAMPSRHTQEYLKPLLQALRGLAFRVEAPAVAQRMSLEWDARPSDREFLK